MKTMPTLLNSIALALVMTTAFYSEIAAREVRNNMSSICKYEAERHFPRTQRNIRTLPVERTHNGFTVYGQSPRNTRRALYFECRFDRRGAYRSIRKIRDTRYPTDMGHRHTSYTPAIVRRICKGEASVRWRMNPRNVRIDQSRRISRDRYLLKLRGRSYRGVCEISGSGHIYGFKTAYANGDNQHRIPQEARRACKRQAASRWGTRPNNIRINNTRRLGRDDFMVRLSRGSYRAECEVSGRGRIYLFSEY